MVQVCLIKTKAKSGFLQLEVRLDIKAVGCIEVDSCMGRVLLVLINCRYHWCCCGLLMLLVPLVLQAGSAGTVILPMLPLRRLVLLWLSGSATTTVAAKAAGAAEG